MASPWRRRRMCLLSAGTPFPAALKEISAVGAVLLTSATLPIGARVELGHPDAGTISGVVSAIRQDGIMLSFEATTSSVAFALAAITADMSLPA
jgi:hypothetical protein